MEHKKMRSRKSAKRYRMRRRRRFLVITCTASAVVAAISIVGLTKSNSDFPENNRCKYYTIIEVEKDRTLWDISQEYMTDEYLNWGQYADEVMLINNLSSTHLKCGDVLAVPYYSTEGMMPDEA